MPPVLVAVLSLLAIGILVENVIASRRIVHDEFGSSSQKMAQLLFVWLVPVIGAVIVFLLTRNSLGPGSGRYAPEKEEPDEDLAIAKTDYGSND